MSVFALVVDAKDKTAAAFYEHHGLANFSRNPLIDVLPTSDPCKEELNAVPCRGPTRQNGEGVQRT